MSGHVRPHFTYLRPYEAEDRDWVYWCATDPGNARHSRWRGITLSPHEFEHAFWQGVRTQLIAVSSADGRRLGVCSAYDYNPPGSVRMAFLPDPGGVDAVLIAELLRTFLQNIFRHDPVAKVYMEVPAFVNINETLFQRVFSKEATLTDYAYWDGELWDVAHWAITRQAFEGRLEAHARGDHLRLSANLASSEALKAWLSETLDTDAGLVEHPDSLLVLEIAELLESDYGIDADAIIASIAARESRCLDSIWEEAARAYAAIIANDSIARTELRPR